MVVAGGRSGKVVLGLLEKEAQRQLERAKQALAKDLEALQIELLAKAARACCVLLKGFTDYERIQAEAAHAAELNDVRGVILMHPRLLEEAQETCGCSCQKLKS